MQSLETWAAAIADNYKKFDSFAWTPPAYPHAAIWYYSNRDATLLDQSNASVIESEIDQAHRDGLKNSISIERHGHWAAGYADCVVFQALTKTGTPTRAAHVVYDLIRRMNDYPVLDEDDYSRRESEATWSNLVENVDYCYRHLETDEPADMEPIYETVYQWISEHEPNELESVDDQGAWIGYEAIYTALMCEGLVTARDVFSNNYARMPYQSMHIPQQRRDWQTVCKLMRKHYQKGD